eukprot:UC4_evm1s1202
MKQKAAIGAYTCVQEVKRDFNMMFYNAWFLHDARSQIYKDASKLWGFAAKWKPGMVPPLALPRSNNHGSSGFRSEQDIRLCYTKLTDALIDDWKSGQSNSHNDKVTRGSEVMRLLFADSPCDRVDLSNDDLLQSLAEAPPTPPRDLIEQEQLQMHLSSPVATSLFPEVSPSTYSFIENFNQGSLEDDVGGIAFFDESKSVSVFELTPPDNTFGVPEFPAPKLKACSSSPLASVRGLSMAMSKTLDDFSTNNIIQKRPMNVTNIAQIPPALAPQFLPLVAIPNPYTSTINKGPQNSIVPSKVSKALPQAVPSSFCYPSSRSNFQHSSRDVNRYKNREVRRYPLPSTWTLGASPRSESMCIADCKYVSEGEER